MNTRQKFKLLQAYGAYQATAEAQDDPEEARFYQRQALQLKRGIEWIREGCP